MWILKMYVTLSAFTRFSDSNAKFAKEMLSRSEVARPYLFVQNILLCNI